MNTVNFDGKIYYTAISFANKVGVTKAYICRLIRQGRLPGYRVGHQYLLPENALEAWQELDHKGMK